mmetsp:Transcript_10747/g.31813  ORF Transcript_10747/g.31813 Transcript_10747/m.31813 type:complete len:100 (-) Transcript_10747:403-702(-)
MTNVARNTASVFLNFIDGMGCNEVVSDAIGDFTSRNALKSAMNASDVCGVVHRAVSIIVYNGPSRIKQWDAPSDLVAWEHVLGVGILSCSGDLCHSLDW